MKKFSTLRYELLMLIMAGISVSFFLLIVSCKSKNNGPGNTVPPHFEILINNNPAFQGETMMGNPAQNIPSIVLTGTDISEKKTITVTVLNNQKKELFQEATIPQIKYGKFSYEFVLNAPLQDPRFARIDYANSIYYIPIKLHKIYGKVSDFQGNPLSVYFLVSWVYDLNLAGKSDSSGNYSLWLPENKVGHIFIDNATWGKSTLECFLSYDFILNDDLNLDLNIGKMELYNMRSWTSYTSFYVYFIPMSLTRQKDKDLNNTRGQWPSLTDNNVRISVNNEEITDRHLVEINDILDFNSNSWRPAYIISLSLGKVVNAYKANKTVVIKVVAKDSFRKGKEMFFDQGEAFIINPSYE